MQKRKYKLKEGAAEKIIKGDETHPDDVAELTNQEIFGKKADGAGLKQSETDESENEGVGDGNIGHTTRDVD